MRTSPVMIPRGWGPTHIAVPTNETDNSAKKTLNRNNLDPETLLGIMLQ